MNQSNETNITDETPDIQAETTAPEQKGKLKFYVIVAFILVVGGWLFWSYSPFSKQFKAQWLQLTNPYSEEQAAAVKESYLPAYNETQQVEPMQNIAEPAAPVEEPPIFDDSQDISAETDDETVAPETAPAVDLTEITQNMQRLQQEITLLQQTIANMHSQQIQQLQQQVRAQLFALLQQTASTRNSLRDKAIAWKSISFMPLLNEEKRSLALRASDELQTLEQNIQASADQVGSLLVVVRQQLEPDDFVQTESLNNIDPYQQTEIMETSWLDWLKEQFHFSKVNQHSLITPDDPYADTKQLISELERLEQLLRSGQWEYIGSLNKLLYQLEQRGIETTLTQETIKDFSRIEKNWQSEALVWMEQL